MSKIPGLFTRREVLIGTGAVLATLGACELTRPRSRVDEALAIFATSDLRSQEGWTTYDNSKYFPCQVDIPPSWKITSLSMGEDQLTYAPYAPFAIRSPGKYDVAPKVLVFRLPIPEWYTAEEDLRRRLVNPGRATDLRVTDVRLSGFDAKMISYFEHVFQGGMRGYSISSTPQQNHHLRMFRKSEVWDVEFSGHPDLVVEEMPKFRRIVDSFKILE